MNVSRFVANGFLIIALIAAALQIGWMAPHLPEKIPNHFGIGGEPDHWVSKNGFLAQFILLHVLIVTILLGIAFLVRVLPTSMINLPNREFWLREERREETMRTVFGFLAWVCSATVLLTMGLFQLSCHVGLQRRTGIDPEFYWLLGSYLVFVLGITGWLVLHFSRTPSGEKTSRSES